MDVEILDEDDDQTIMAVQTLESLRLNYQQTLSPYEIVGITVYRELQRRRILNALENAIATDLLIDLLRENVVSQSRSFMEHYDSEFDAELHENLFSLMFGESVEDKNFTVIEPPKKKAQNESECSICLNSIKKGEEIYDIACKHTFHTSCLYTWMEHRNHDPTCPLCRCKI